MTLINTITGEIYEAVIQEIEWFELETLADNDDFEFNWTKEDSYGIYKISIINDSEILGLMSVSNHVEELRIHIRLLESAKHCVGKNKEIDRISGCLIAYACQLSVSFGYDGFVSLVPKTRLIDHYRNSFGFTQMGRQLAVFMESADFLIRKFIYDEEI